MYPTQHHSQVVGICPGHHPQPIAQNRVLKSKRIGPLNLPGDTPITKSNIRVNASSISIPRRFFNLDAELFGEIFQKSHKQLE